ncbi:hypothetical protein E4U52_005274 [Claviceps spartinae]|nr:hypothetical protein E4U52_005274 [Claviceps spartinae]
MLKQDDGILFHLYAEAYQHCREHHPEHSDDYHGRVEEPEATVTDDEHAELMHADGAGGTGKFFLITAISDTLDRTASISSTCSDERQTGIAANAIKGHTIHSLLRLIIADRTIRDSRTT